MTNRRWEAPILIPVGESLVHLGRSGLEFQDPTRKRADIQSESEAWPLELTLGAEPAQGVLMIDQASGMPLAELSVSVFRGFRLGAKLHVSPILHGTSTSQGILNLPEEFLSSVRTEQREGHPETTAVLVPRGYVPNAIDRDALLTAEGGPGPLRLMFGAASGGVSVMPVFRDGTPILAPVELRPVRCLETGAEGPVLVDPADGGTSVIPLDSEISGKLVLDAELGIEMTSKLVLSEQHSPSGLAAPSTNRDTLVLPFDLDPGSVTVHVEVPEVADLVLFHDGRETTALPTGRTPSALVFSGLLPGRYVLCGSAEVGVLSWEQVADLSPGLNARAIIVPPGGHITLRDQQAASEPKTWECSWPESFNRPVWVSPILGEGSPLALGELRKRLLPGTPVAWSELSQAPVGFCWWSRDSHGFFYPVATGGVADYCRPPLRFWSASEQMLQRPVIGVRFECPLGLGSAGVGEVEQVDLLMKGGQLSEMLVLPAAVEEFAIEWSDGVVEQVSL